MTVLRRFGGKVHAGRMGFWSGKFTALCGLVVPRNETKGVWFANRPSCGACRAFRESGM